MANLITASIAALVTLGVWFFNEKNKRTYEEYKRKEEKYSKLIQSLRGFYIGTSDSALKQEFITQLNQSWMYCPDEAIKKAYKFLSTVHGEEKTYSQEEKENAMGDFILSIRVDLLSKKNKVY